MADGEDGSVPGSPPLPKKGSYNIDFDSLDDSVNPFESKIQLGSSPPITSSSSYNFDADALDDIDPFKPRSTVANSPVGSPKSKSYLNNNNNGPFSFDEPATSPVTTENNMGSSEGGKPADAEPSPKASPKYVMTQKFLKDFSSDFLSPFDIRR